MLDTLRKRYDQLKPFERAVMLTEAMERLDHDAMDSLESPALWDSAMSLLYERVFALLAFHVVHQSQKADALYFCSLSSLLLVDDMHENAAGDREKEKQLEARLDALLDYMDAGERRRVAWLLALQALDDETGGACMATARMVAGEYINSTLETAKKEGAEVDYSEELEILRRMWGIAIKNNPQGL